MPHSLRVHPASVCDAVAHIEVEVTRSTDTLKLRYIVRGDIDRISVPEPKTSVRADGLWQHTCCEAFLRAKGSRRYHEFNFSPSTAWAAYRFDDYRAGMRPAELPAPRISVDTSRDQLRLDVALDVSNLSLKPGATVAAFSAVIEERDGRKSYWALAHADGAPDFHRDEAFVASF